MEMNQIRYFLAVCEHRNFTHAARASNASQPSLTGAIQPSLTAAIKKLEDELGGPLFLRDRAGCRLTPLGALLRPRLQNVQRETREAKAEAIRHVRLDRVPIAVGVGGTVGQGRISEAVERHRLRRPEAEIELIVDARDALLEGLRDGRFDIAVTAAEASPDLYRVDPLYRVVIAALCVEGEAEGWVCGREAGGIAFGRVIRPGGAAGRFSVDVVRMADTVGPHHSHPKGEIDLILPLEGAPAFDGVRAGWCVYPPGSAHHPTVTGGSAHVLYLLPEGEIAFTGA